MPESPDLSPRALRPTARDRPLFVERARDLELVANTLRHSGNTLLLGDRGIGKSTLLHFLESRLEEAGERVVFVDGRVASSAAEFLALIRDRLGAWRGLRDSTSSLGDVAGLSSPRMLLRPPRTHTQLLLDEIADLRDLLREKERVVLLVDGLPSPEVARVLFGRLRDELWELPLVWCVAADTRDRGSYVQPPADAFWTRIFTVDPLDEGAARDLLKRRLGRRLSSDVEKAIVAAGEGIPRRLLAAAHDVVADGRTAAELLAESAERDSKLQQIGEPGRRLLAELQAGGPAGPSDSALLQKLGWSRGRAAQVFNQLEAAGLVIGSRLPGGTGRPRRVYEAVS